MGLEFLAWLVEYKDCDVNQIIIRPSVRTDLITVDVIYNKKKGDTQRDRISMSANKLDEAVQKIYDLVVEKKEDTISE